ncbi:hypothetical protein SLEP1_g32345 [Rubroshorea leprosula]|uniref:Alpha/beta hydrolase fold-3 domain-containing protein n=1 Tax=Rubroshorea leprosula TaxID=152421 RepID=A0AAV5KCZ0_9ROSI|nr:hypothetical protein SLEP1_g32345 [Rubroshorea leprosula]
MSSTANVVGANEDLITENLLCLPATSVVNFKLVSKRWLSLIPDPISFFATIVGIITQSLVLFLVGHLVLEIQCSGCNDPLLNPAIYPEKLAQLVCSKVLICVSEKDWMTDRGWTYREALRKIGWGGSVEIVEIEGESHVFHLFKPEGENGVDLMNRVASFLTHE